MGLNPLWFTDEECREHIRERDDALTKDKWDAIMLRRGRQKAALDAYIDSRIEAKLKERE